jgi:hypothetical protein
MASIECYRGAGDRVGAPIVEPVLAASVLVDRGRAEMDAHAHRMQRVEADVVYQPGLTIGQLIALDDPIGTAPRRAKIVGMSVSFTDGRIDCALSLEAPASDEASSAP